ncbi:hypothetical protein VB834_11030 [Limnoraphis robusta Tam1]|jgi:hypothetical protein|uniref:Uncharacterized protein n=2 Tax=Limnoraphis robusta TaxID=1118279 RepID=A0A0F5YF46_9CYAN|nr:hypothetical protein [Limnoraphis robusta]KKD37252.1 hypothetical protein WN50_15400 [Limnoraphis robusta CS-951]MEA5497033.1 hypothetical protein [Limnoraphis robusta BA-68 BA1]MEA5523019.1 hypothetical protein [Limnoraphis robusta CCNP1315]MEA5539565.1 hypothetical protein [Limnoraphis robusta Tam1]MEA5546905.1 hypothetical protein [Limnoraphis robusta CCNP1324]
MFNLNQLFGAADLISDLAGAKERKIRQIKFFRDKKGSMGIAFFDNQTIHGEYWIENIMVPPEYETTFKASGYKIGTKYDVFLFGLQPFSANKEVLKTPGVQKRLLNMIFEAMK